MHQSFTFSCTGLKARARKGKGYYVDISHPKPLLSPCYFWAFFCTFMKKSKEMTVPVSQKPLWTPSREFIESSNMHAFSQWLAEERGLVFEGYPDLWQWSVEHIEDFWEAIWSYFDIQSHSPYTSVLEMPDEGMIGASWFEGARLNYAEHIFRMKNERHPAVLFAAENQELSAISWAELEASVSRVASFLKEKDIEPGDGVVSYMPNIPQALIAFLACNAIGAVWSSCSPDFGTASVVDRFQQIEPKMLFAANGYQYNGKSYNRIEEVCELKKALSSLEELVWVSCIEGQAGIEGDAFWDEIMERPAAKLEFEAVPFSHPMWVLYSSGTTGKPKAITHSVGGMLLEHLKALSLHQNVKPGDRFFWYSTTGWMMWNYANAALLAGGTVVLYDGAAGYPELDALWKFAQDARINHFGGGAAYYIACMRDGMNPGEKFDFSALQSLGSTGSPLPPEEFQWVYDTVKKDLWLVSISGGSDVCSGFVGGSPYLPVYAGEIQCRMLGCSVEAYNEDGKPVEGEVGEMVITRPMPAMPIYFWNDADNERYRASYFEMYPGVWRHGDWLKITKRGSVVIFGRSDATLNRGGVRIGTGEVYRAVDTIHEVEDSLVISIEREDGSYYMPLYVVLAEGQELGPELIKKIKQQLRSQYSPRHVPDEIIAVPEIPYTISGKKMETPIKKILMGVDPKKAVSKDAMKNPGAIDFFMENILSA
jgi:acetoacetyl-CoA synthetase